ncbi:hypothetical protein ACFL0Q_08540 [Thermodesulfobacteriota bacterium]
MNKNSMFTRCCLLLGVLTLPFLFGCHGTSVSIGTDPYHEPQPGYEKGGPPPWAPAHGYRAKYRYNYYPSSRVYLDSGRGIFFFYRNGDWRVSVSLPAYISVDFREYVTLEMDSERPYEYQMDVERYYPPGKLKKK